MYDQPWYERLEFEANPLDVRPNVALIGLEEAEEQVSNHIVKGEICFLNGLTGTGKTSLLKRLQNKHVDHSFIYLDAQDLPDSFNLEEELKKKRSFFDKITFKKFPSKKPVLIIDEFQATDPNLILEARGKWESQNSQVIKSIVIAQISKHLANCTDAFRERIGHRVVELPTLDDEQMKLILLKRLDNPKTNINYAHRLSHEAMDMIIKSADGNPRRLLEYADMIFDFHHRSFGENNPITRNTYYITGHAAKEILNLNKVAVQGFTPGKTQVSREGMEDFGKVFTPNQQKLLGMLMLHERTSMDDICKELNINRNLAKKEIKTLKRKNAVISIIDKDKVFYDVAPRLKRMTVKE